MALRLLVLAVASSFLLTPMLADAAQKKPGAAKKKPATRKRSTATPKKAAPKKAVPPPVAPPVEEKKVESDLVPSADLRGPTRLDFDDRLIQGQTNKSGAVYLF